MVFRLKKLFLVIFILLNFVLALYSMIDSGKYSEFKDYYVRSEDYGYYSESTNDDKNRDYREFRLMTSLWTRHSSDNDLYNNNTNLLAIEYRPVKDIAFSLGYFDNSFATESYIFTVSRYFRPFNKTENFYFNLGVGIVKGYTRVKQIIDNETGEVLKQSKFDTNIGGDYMLGGSLGLGYDITDRFSICFSYVGAFISVLTVKLN